jgi:DNA-binding transcriptional MerR regulator
VDVSPERLLTIGEFSRLSLLSVRMLRYYDARGVLAPTRVDPASGYRSYDPAMLRTAVRLRALRDAGLGVAELAACAPFTDADLLRRVLRDRRRAAEAELAVAAGRLRDIDRFLDDLEAPAMSTPITRTTLPARTVAAVRDVIPTYADEGVLWRRLADGMAAAGAVPAPDPAAVAVFHDPGFVEQDADVEVQLDVAAPFDPAPGDATGVRFGREPALDVVVGELRGPYEGVGALMADLGAWIAGHGLRVGGPMRNLYLVGPAQDPDPAAWVTRVCLPVTAA